MKTRTYQLKPGYAIEDIAGQKVLIAPAVGNIDYTKMLVLSESAALVVGYLMEKEFSIDELVYILLEEYEVDEAKVRKELLLLLNQLNDLNILL